MTSQAFEAVLGEPDNNASHLQLHRLITTGGFSNFKDPAVTKKYLRAFCDTTLSFIWRRWIGLALAGMIEASTDVVDHFKHLREELHSLGVILLSNTEREDTKIIAGIIIRQGLEKGIEYTSFWASEKVKNSIPKFPEECGPRWMADFQSFLDTLGDLALVNSNADPSIIYPISLITSDGFKWRESSGSIPIALIQAGLLTIVASDDSLRDIQFVDIPVAHICNVRSRPSTLHAPQPCTTRHEPWDLILTLRCGSWTYCLNATRRSGTEVTLLFCHSKDAEEWKNCVQEHLKLENNSSTTLPPKMNPLMSRSSPINLGPVPLPHINQLATQHKQEPIIQSNGSISSGASRTKRACPTTKPTTYRKGKLPNVSQTANLSGSRQVHSQIDVFEIPNEEIIRSSTPVEASANDVSSPSSLLQKQVQVPVFASQAGTASANKHASKSKRKPEDDDEFIPGIVKRRRKTNSKRRSRPSAVRGNGQVQKKARIKPTQDADESLPSVVSSRHSLIEGLLASCRPSQASDVLFKKPKLPLHTPQIPTTPSKTKFLSNEPPLQLQTPVGVRKCLYNTPLPHMFSSPPLSKTIRALNDKLQTSAVDVEILSSNSKPVPASPNAESTAISGHADRDDVDFEKREGEIQTARSDPFSQRRAVQKASSFIRRLTGEDKLNEQSIFKADHPNNMSDEMTNLDSSSETLLSAATVPSPQPIAPLKGTPLYKKDAQRFATNNFIAETSQQIINGTQKDQSLQDYSNIDINVDTTLIDYTKDDHVNIELHASPLQLRSSPPPFPGTPSSHSSTSAEFNCSSQPPVKSSEAEEIEWKASLQPHQCALHDLLLRTSKRVLRHIVDNETAVTDVAEVFARDGEHLLESLLKRHDREYDIVFQDMENKMKGLKRDLETSIKQLTKERRRLKAIT
ncbi:hypothetical protein BKA66DRAFT_525520 [Pyrenochaeta sp. MPI-SDFR-AT-0127]|nr:hypothetical protein BKA66DRAFT_525520 [Pyrenochaeta sp. MPI-SDFR-AT-0127]